LSRRWRAPTPAIGTGLATRLIDAARRLCAAGAGIVLLGANTAHIVADQVAAARDELQHIIIDELTVGRVEQRSLQAP